MEAGSVGHTCLWLYEKEEISYISLLKKHIDIPLVL